MVCSVATKHTSESHGLHQGKKLTQTPFADEEPDI